MPPLSVKGNFKRKGLVPPKGKFFLLKVGHVLKCNGVQGSMKLFLFVKTAGKMALYS